MKKIKPWKIVFVFLALVIFLFIFIPLLRMVFSANPKLISSALRDKEIVASILLSLKMALFSTVFALFTGIPLAYIFARGHFPLKSFFEAVIDIPVMIPHTAAGIALLSVFGSRFLLGKIFGFFGIKFVGTEFGIAIGMMFVSLSYLVNQVKNGFRKIDVKLENVARSLGANERQVFFRISLPLVRREILSGSIMMWARGISEFGAVVILAYHPMTAPVLILERFNSFGLQYAKPVAVVLVLVCILIFTILRWISNKRGN